MTEDSGNLGGKGLFAQIDIPRSELFELLADRRRQHLLQVLVEYGPELALADAADELAAREYDKPFPEIDDEAVLEIYTMLYHHHVPKLESAGVLTYNQDRDVIVVSDKTEPLAQFCLGENPETP